MGVLPRSKVNVSVVIVGGSMSLLKVAVIPVLRDTSMAVLPGLVDHTVGALGLESRFPPTALPPYPAIIKTISNVINNK
jgi:hypothetical protein